MHVFPFKFGFHDMFQSASWYAAPPARPVQASGTPSTGTNRFKARKPLHIMLSHHLYILELPY